MGTTPTVLSQQAIDDLIRSQLGIDPTTPLPSNPDIALALTNAIQSSTVDAQVMNQNLTRIYQVEFENWADQVNAGKIPNTNPPKPPDGYKALPASDGWTYIIRVPGNPVCDMPPIPQTPAAPKPNNVLIGVQIGATNYWQCLPGDTMPNGYQTPKPTQAADGTVGFFQKYAIPWGAYYIKIG